MQRDIPTVVVVPDAAVAAAADSAAGAQRFQCSICCTGMAVRYLSWLGICDLRALAERHGMIFVCPDGENSWYWDSPLDPRSQFETFVSTELVDWVDARYPTIPAREDVPSRA